MMVDYMWQPMKRKVLSYLFFLFFLFAGCNALENGISVTRTELQYDSLDINKLDVWYNEYDNRPNKSIVVFIHGGSWNSGDKAEWTKEKSFFFINRNCVAVSLNYRLCTSLENVHPAQIEDIARSIAFLQDTIRFFGGNPERIILIGHSAGAHLASLLVCNQKYLNSQGVDIEDIVCVVNIDAGAYLTLDSTLFSAAVINDFYKVAGRNPKGWDDFIPSFHVKDCEYLPRFILLHSTQQYRKHANEEFAKVLRNSGFLYGISEIKIEDHNEMFVRFPFYEGLNESLLDSLMLNEFEVY